MTCCPSCRRHIRDEEKCPFCAAPRRRAGVMAATIAAVLSISACAYGMPILVDAGHADAGTADASKPDAK